MSKHKLLLELMASFFCLFFISCSDKEVFEPELEHLSIDSAAESTLAFYNSTTKNQSRSSNSDLVIDNISRVSYYHDGDGLKEYPTMMSKSANEAGEFTIATVSFHIDSITGFSLVCEKDDFNEVVHFTLGMKPTEVQKIEPLEALINNFPQILYDKFSNQSVLSRDDDFVHTDCTDLISINSPNFEMSWDQTWVNARTPDCTCLNHNGKQPIGCVGLAVGLAIVKARHFSPKFPENYNVDFDYIESLDLGAYNWRKVASDFFFEVAEGCKTSYSCNGSGSNIDKALAYLNEQNYQITKQDLNTTSLDYKRVQTNLQKNLVTLCTGRTSQHSSVGHMWVIDGIRYFDKTRPDIWHQYHCVWGSSRIHSWTLFYYQYSSDIAYNWRNYCIFIDGLK